MLYNGEKDDPDHECHWFVLNKACYKSRGQFLSPNNNRYCLQDTNDKKYLDLVTTQSILALNDVERKWSI